VYVSVHETVTVKTPRVFVSRCFVPTDCFRRPLPEFRRDIIPCVTRSSEFNLTISSLFRLVDGTTWDPEYTDTYSGGGPTVIFFDIYRLSGDGERSS